MAYERLEVDTATVRDVATNLAIVHDSLDGAQAASVSLAQIVGHPRLATAVEDFAGKWDNRREELTTQLGQMKAAAEAIADGFECVDSELASAISAGPSDG